MAVLYICHANNGSYPKMGVIYGLRVDPRTRATSSLVAQKAGKQLQPVAPTQAGQTIQNPTGRETGKASRSRQGHRDSRQTSQVQRHNFGLNIEGAEVPIMIM